MKNGPFYVELLWILLCNFWIKLGYFKLQHLVTLITSHTTIRWSIHFRQKCSHGRSSSSNRRRRLHGYVWSSIRSVLKSGWSFFFIESNFEAKNFAERKEVEQDKEVDRLVVQLDAQRPKHRRIERHVEGRRIDFRILATLGRSGTRVRPLRLRPEQCLHNAGLPLCHGLPLVGGVRLWRHANRRRRGIWADRFIPRSLFKRVLLTA